VKVRDKEEQADTIARILDTALSVPGLRSRVGFDPFVGMLPIVGDLLATMTGATILVIARQVAVPGGIQMRKWFNVM
jgi:hypothetical protein